MMRLTYICPRCNTTVRREMPSGKGGAPQGGVVKCPKGHGNISLQTRRFVEARYAQEMSEVQHSRPKHDALVARIVAHREEVKALRR
jgi:hypothetical protein